MKIVIVDDDCLVTEALKTILEVNEDVQVLAELIIAAAIMIAVTFLNIFFLIIKPPVLISIKSIKNSSISFI